jgi:hypothetical protein
VDLVKGTGKEKIRRYYKIGDLAGTPFVIS